MKKIYVLTIKWGHLYKSSEINRMFNSIKKKTKYELNFYCFTDNAEGLLPEIKSKPLPIVNVTPEQLPYAYKKEVGLCRDDLGDGELYGKRVLFLDIDTVPLKSLDDFFDFPKDDGFYTIKDWNQTDGTVGNASVYSWVVGKLGYVLKDFEEKPDYYIKKFFTASQEYLSSKIIERYGKLNFWPKNWCVSFKYDCIPSWPMRLFFAPKLPHREIAKVLCFHGEPKIQDSINGVWNIESDKGRWKRIYKFILPSKWIEEFL